MLWASSFKFGIGLCYDNTLCILLYIVQEFKSDHPYSLNPPTSNRSIISSVGDHIFGFFRQSVICSQIWLAMPEAWLGLSLEWLGLGFGCVRSSFHGRWPFEIIILSVPLHFTLLTLSLSFHAFFGWSDPNSSLSTRLCPYRAAAGKVKLTFWPMNQPIDSLSLVFVNVHCVIVSNYLLFRAESMEPWWKDQINIAVWLRNQKSPLPVCHRKWHKDAMPLHAMPRLYIGMTHCLALDQIPSTQVKSIPWKTWSHGLD